MSNKNQRQKGCTTCDPVQKRSDKEQALYDIAMAETAELAAWPVDDNYHEVGCGDAGDPDALCGCS